MCVYHCPHLSLPLHCSNVWIIIPVFTFTDNFAHLLNIGSFPDETDRTAMVSGSDRIGPVISLYIHNYYWLWSTFTFTNREKYTP